MSPEPTDPQLSDHEVDARFADLMAHWERGSESKDTTSPGTETPTSDPATEVAPEEGPESVPRPPAGPPASVTLSFPVWRQATGPSIDEVLDAEEEAGFTPPEVALPPAEDLHYWGAVAGLVLGPIVVIWAVLSRPFYGSWWTVAGVGLFVAGFALLVLRGPGDRDPEDDDNGARV